MAVVNTNVNATVAQNGAGKERAINEYRDGAPFHRKEN